MTTKELKNKHEEVKRLLIRNRELYLLLSLNEDAEDKLIKKMEQEELKGLVVDSEEIEKLEEEWSEMYEEQFQNNLNIVKFLKEETDLSMKDARMLYMTEKEKVENLIMKLTY